jgi:hypothetical protein
VYGGLAHRTLFRDIRYIVDTLAQTDEYVGSPKYGIRTAFGIHNPVCLDDFDTFRSVLQKFIAYFRGPVNNGTYDCYF